MKFPRTQSEPLQRTFSFLLLVAALLLPAGPLPGRQKPGINVEVKVVNVLATVRDKHGAIVPNLSKDDFVLEEDGHPQVITYFTRETDLPLTLGLLVDTSESQRRVLDQERTASHSFLDDMMRENKDQAFVLHFDREVELLQDVTDSRQKLQNALELLGEPQLNRHGDPSDPGASPRMHGGGTLLYDAVYLASDEVIKRQSGRKALIILSDGVDHGSQESLERSIMTAQRADTVVYSILFADDHSMQNPLVFLGPGMGGHGGGHRGGGRFPEQRVDGKKVLERISKETGGRLFEVSKKETLEDIYKTIAEELRNQYSLGYTPGPDTSTGYHKLQLTAKPKDLTVESREGYYWDRPE